MTAEERLVALSKALGLGDRPRETITRVMRVYDLVDQKVAAGASGLALPCKMGCDACCHESVFLSAPEFLVVAQHVMEVWSPEARAELFRQMDELAARFEDELELLESVEGVERDDVARRVRFRCPFLSATGACKVYPVRELNARTFGFTWDERRAHAFGCELTHARLRVLGSGQEKLAGARAARRELVAAVQGTERVHVYPWWFTRYRDYLR